MITDTDVIIIPAIANRSGARRDCNFNNVFNEPNVNIMVIILNFYFGPSTRAERMPRVKY